MTPPMSTCCTKTGAGDQLEQVVEQTGLKNDDGIPRIIGFPLTF